MVYNDLHNERRRKDMDGIFLDNVFRVLEKKKGKKSRLFFECSF